MNRFKMINNFKKTINFRNFSSLRESQTLQDVVLIDGCRIPFMQSGTSYKNLMAHDLARKALKGIITRNAIEPKLVDRVIVGTVIQEARTTNIAREAALGAGFPLSTPAHTVTMACISSNQAITSAIDSIRSNQAQIIIAGGTETMSDVPIRLSRSLRLRLLRNQREKGFNKILKFFRGLSLSEISLELPAISEFSTNETMGRSADRLGMAFGVSRKDQDEFALRSHLLAAKALNENKLAAEIIATSNGESDESLTKDNGVRGDSTIEKLESLKPAFIKPFGSVTAGNSSYLTDGASSVLLMSASKAKELGYQPKAVIRDYVYVAQDPKDELLLGPAYATAKMLARHNLKLSDISVFEFHEAFAAQILANLNALNSTTWCSKALGLHDKIGEIPMDKFNVFGGSLSIGHPFGATGCRLVTTAANRLNLENGRFALVAACAAGGLGHATLIERI
eukprot:TRINITY_DN300_c3_g1_i1.p1 TRINITY_DN300_c3_g1~~TRINITY_DN300_c3_g1_i1.p1  ORF type:complete len:453 (-),score=220.21 TRINITY_DN300_c3_g1_i1:140-1498(-)